MRFGVRLPSRDAKSLLNVANVLKTVVNSFKIFEQDVLSSKYVVNFATLQPRDTCNRDGYFKGIKINHLE